MMVSSDTPVSISLLRKAKTVVKKYMKVYTICIIFASLGGFLFGFDTGARIRYLSAELTFEL